MCSSLVNQTKGYIVVAKRLLISCLITLAKVALYAIYAIIVALTFFGWLLGYENFDEMFFG